MALLPSSTPFGRSLSFLALPPPSDDVVGLHRGAQSVDDVGHFCAPFLLAEAFEAAQADVVLEGLALLVRQVRELHRLDAPVDDQCAAEAGAEAEEQHAAAAVAAERLHGGVVEDAHRLAERALDS